MLLLLIDYTPRGNALFDAAPIGGNVWLYIIAFVPGMLLIEELRKWVMRKMTRRKPSDNTGQ